MSATITEAMSFMKQGREARAKGIAKAPSGSSSHRFWWAEGWLHKHDELLQEMKADRLDITTESLEYALSHPEEFK